MPRFHCLFLRRMPLHIVQRGHNRQPVFVECADYEYYLANLGEMKSELSIRVYAYCLMTNHIHLLIEPGEQAEKVSRLIRVLAARQTRRVNKLERRTGSLWEGRFKASLVDSDSYLLACYRYIDLNPVRAAMTVEAEDYVWSSYRQHAALSDDQSIDLSAAYRALGATTAARATAYCAYVSDGTKSDELALIRTALMRNQLTGTARFQQQIAERTGRRLSSRGPGRPRSRK